MPAVQNLKKQLRGVKSTQKLTKAMKTVSTVKFSKLNGINAKYSAFGNECAAMYDRFKDELVGTVHIQNPDAPILYLVIASDKGLCGSFNSELLNFAMGVLEKEERPFTVMPCGKKAVSRLREKNIPFECEYPFNELPSYEDGAVLLKELLLRLETGENSAVKVIYQKYTNMAKQRPVCITLFQKDSTDDGADGMMFAPDRETVVTESANTVFGSVIYKILLEAALGAQASTLMTMRSAYDTASEFASSLEGQINRMRQSAVTSDVLETFSENRE